MREGAEEAEKGKTEEKGMVWAEQKVEGRRCGEEGRGEGGERWRKREKKRRVGRERGALLPQASPCQAPGPSRGCQWHKDNEDWEKDRERTPSPPTQPTIPTDGSPSF